MNQRSPHLMRGWLACTFCTLVTVACGFANNSVIQGVNSVTPPAGMGTVPIQMGHITSPKRVVGAQYPPQPHPTEPAHEHAQLPPLPGGPFHPRRSVSPPMQLVPSTQARALPLPARIAAGPALSVLTRPAGDVSVTTDTPFASALSDSRDGEETSEASSGSVVFFTGNWFAAYSTDGGASFTAIDPSTIFPTASGQGWCCDQVVHYDAQHDLFFWLIQYKVNSSGENIDRLALASPATLASTRATGWYYYDFAPAMFSLLGTWFDFPDLALGSNTLYWTTNVFKEVTAADGSFAHQYQGSLLSGLPLGPLAQGIGFGFGYVYRSDTSNFTAAQNTGAHVFWASQINTSQLRVYDWLGGTGVYSWHDLDVASWTDGSLGTVVHDPITLSGTDAPSLDWNAHHVLNADSDGRVRGAAMAGGAVWFAWSAGSDGQYTQPHIEVVQVSTTSVTLLSQYAIWNTSYAFARPALTSNSASEIGMAFFWGARARTMATRRLPSSRGQRRASMSRAAPWARRGGETMSPYARMLQMPPNSPPGSSRSTPAPPAMAACGTIPISSYSAAVDPAAVGSPSGCLVAPSAGARGRRMEQAGARTQYRSSHHGHELPPDRVV